MPRNLFAAIPLFYGAFTLLDLSFDWLLNQMPTRSHQSLAV